MVGPAVALQMYNTYMYIVPDMLCGLEALVLSDTEIKELSIFNR